MIKMPGIPESISKVRLVRLGLSLRVLTLKYRFHEPQKSALLHTYDDDVYRIKIAKEGVGFVQFAFFFGFQMGI